jgi:TonB family protein
MMAAWMLAATLFAALLGVAALAAERGLRTVGREARGVWIAALGAAVCWPAIAPAVASAVAGLTRRDYRAPIGAVGTALTSAGGVLPTAPRGWAAYADVALVAVWAIASLVLLVRLVWAMRILARVERSADREIIDGVQVLVTPALGPAVFGTRRSRVVIPRWLLDLDEPLRALVLRHEQEHCRARDPQVTLALAAAAVLMPWNAGVWWIARRLRLAVELDCDQRVLRDVEDPERYSKLLLFIAQRQSLVRLAPMLAESSSHLSRRIAAMNSPRPAHGRARVAVLSAVAVLALVYSTRFASELTAAPSVMIPRAASAAREQQPIPPSVTAPQAAAPVAAAPSPRVNTVPPAAITPLILHKDLPGEMQGTNPPAAMVVPQSDDRNVIAIPGSPSPRYPEILKEAGVEGAVVAAFVVDTNGVLDPQSIKIIARTHQLFSDAFVAVAPELKFLPAILNGKKVKQVVQQPYLFNLMSSSNAPIAGRADTKVAVAAVLTTASATGFVTLSNVIITGIVP